MRDWLIRYWQIIVFVWASSHFLPPELLFLKSVADLHSLSPVCLLAALWGLRPLALYYTGQQKLLFIYYFISSDSLLESIGYAALIQTWLFSSTRVLLSIFGVFERIGPG